MGRSTSACFGRHSAAAKGVTAFASGDSAETRVERADRAMYRPKTDGRKRVELEPRPTLTVEPAALSA
jgi:PleD family two-component response regulator